MDFILSKIISRAPPRNAHKQCDIIDIDTASDRSHCDTSQLSSDIDTVKWICLLIVCEFFFVLGSMAIISIVSLIAVQSAV